MDGPAPGLIGGMPGPVALGAERLHIFDGFVPAENVEPITGRSGAPGKLGIMPGIPATSAPGNGNIGMPGKHAMPGGGGRVGIPGGKPHIPGAIGGIIGTAAGAKAGFGSGGWSPLKRATLYPRSCSISLGIPSMP